MGEKAVIRDEGNMVCLVSVWGILICHTMEFDFCPGQKWLGDFKKWPGKLISRVHSQ